jgi:hypothetical protein
MYNHNNHSPFLLGNPFLFNNLENNETFAALPRKQAHGPSFYSNPIVIQNNNYNFGMQNPVGTSVNNSSIYVF